MEEENKKVNEIGRIEERTAKNRMGAVVGN